MMTLNQLLNKRRSIRKFDNSVSISNGVITEIIKAGLQVPSPSDSMPINIYQISQEDTRCKLKNIISFGRNRVLETVETKKQRNIINYYWRHTSYLFDAPVILMITHTPFTNFSNKLFPEKHSLKENKNENVIMITVGAFLFAMSLKAEDLGLSSSILTAPITFCSNIGEQIGINKDECLCAFMALGKSAERNLPARKDKYIENYFTKL